MRITLTIGAYLIMAAILAFLGYCTWFATVWGVSLYVAFSLYPFGLIAGGVVFLGLQFALSKLPAKKEDPPARLGDSGSV
jgi:hypothetical protein